MVSRNSNMNDEGQNGNRLDRYHPVQVPHDILRFIDKQMGFHSKSPNLSLLVGRWCLGNMGLVLIDSSLK